MIAAIFNDHDRFYDVHQIICVTKLKQMGEPSCVAIRCECPSMEEVTQEEQEGPIT
jgi:hypothetical protein